MITSAFSSALLLSHRMPELNHFCFRLILTSDDAVLHCRVAVFSVHLKTQTRQSGKADFTFLCVYAVRAKPVCSHAGIASGLGKYGILCENTTSSTKPKYIIHCIVVGGRPSHGHINMH